MNKIISVYWFGILVLVAGGIFLMVNAFHSAPYDIRNLEARILSNKIADCISDKGVIKESFIDSEGAFNEQLNENFLETCSIILDQPNPEYYIGVDFYSIDDLNNPVFSVSEGNKNWVGFCEIQEGRKEHENLPKCLEQRLYSIDSGNSQHLIKILSVVGKAEENVKS